MAKINVNEVLAESKFNPFHWVLFVCSFLIITFDGFDMVVYGSSVPLIMKYWSLKGAYAGLIGTYVLIGAAIGSLVFGRLADKIGRRRTIFMCTITFTLGMILCGVSPNPIVFGIFRVITGIGIGGCMPNIVSLATEWTPARRRNVMVAATYTGMQWGGILAAVVGLWLLRPPDVWRPVYLFGGLTILLLPFLATQLPESAPRLIVTGRIGELAKFMKRANPGFKGTDKDEYEVDKGVKAVGVDQQALDHPLNTAIGPHGVGPLLQDVNDEYERVHGRKVIEDFPEWEPCHKILLCNGVMGFENVGGDIAKVVGKRVKIMGFPIRWYKGDGSIVRLVAEIDEDDMNKVPDRIYKYGTT